MPAVFAEDFQAILDEMTSLREITFPRSIQPSVSWGPTIEQPMLLMFDNGSREASCALAYACWQLADARFFCCLIAVAK